MIELRPLQYFLAAAREQSISRAAQSLGITQPAMSRQIAQLEKDLGAELFLRGRPLRLTEAGLMLLRRAREIEALIAKTEEEFASQSEPSGIISIGCGGLAASALLSRVICAFRPKYPKVRFELYANSAQYVSELLAQGSLDFGILLEPVDVSRFEFLRLPGKERWGLMMPAGHPLAGKSGITRDDLRSVPLVTSSRSAVLKGLDAWLGFAADELDILATHNLNNNSIFLVRDGAACALGVEGACAMLLGDEMVFRPLVPELSMSSVLAWKEMPHPGSAAGRFLAAFRELIGQAPGKSES